MASGNRNEGADVAGKNAKFLSFLSTIPIDIFFLSSGDRRNKKLYIGRSFLDAQKIERKNLFYYLYNYYRNINYVIIYIIFNIK